MTTITSYLTRRLFFATALLMATNWAASPAQAQCVGDCDGSASVSVGELITGVNIALGKRPLDDCASFDVDGNGSVSIGELIQAVRVALGETECMPSPTATPTEQATPTETQTPPEGCGDGVVDIPGGETCDDGNLEEGDGCPANCHIADCELSGEPLLVDVKYATNPASDVSGMQLFFRYPDGVVGIQGRVMEQSVRDSITSPNFSITPNDRDYGITLVLLDPSFFGPSSGTAVTVTFETCVGADVPTAGDFRCDLESVSDPNLTEIVGDTTCTIEIR